VGSGNLFATLGKADTSGEDDRGAAGKLLRYLIRMSTRPTPYGLFAGVGLARWGPETNLTLSSGRPRTRTRPDMAWLLRLVLEAESRSEVRTSFAIWPILGLLYAPAGFFCPKPRRPPTPSVPELPYRLGRQMSSAEP
jgi:hypothetical protein